MTDNEKQLLMRKKAVPIPNTSLNFALPTLEEILDMGEDKYFSYVQAILIDTSKIQMKAEEGEQDIEIEDFQLFCLYLVYSEETFIKENFFNGLELFFGKKFALESFSIFSLERNAKGELSLAEELTEATWNYIRNLIAETHGTEVPQLMGNLTPREREIVLKLNRNKRLVQKYKTNQGKTKNSGLIDKASSICAYCGTYNLFNVWQLNYYQLLDQFRRTTAVEDFNFMRQQLVAGADPAKLDTSHWSCEF